MPFQPHTPPCPSKPIFFVLLTQAWPQVYAHTQEECVNSEEGLQLYIVFESEKKKTSRLAVKTSMGIPNCKQRLSGHGHSLSAGKHKRTIMQTGIRGHGQSSNWYRMLLIGNTNRGKCVRTGVTTGRPAGQATRSSLPTRHTPLCCPDPAASNANVPFAPLASWLERMETLQTSLKVVSCQMAHLISGNVQNVLSCTLAGI